MLYFLCRPPRPLLWKQRCPLTSAKRAPHASVPLHLAKLAALGPGTGTGAAHAPTSNDRSTPSDTNVTISRTENQEQQSRSSFSATAVPPVEVAQQLADLPFYSQYPLDRKAEWRRDENFLNEIFARPDAKLIPLLRDKVLVRPSATNCSAGAAPLLQPVLLCPAATHAELVAASPARAFLGIDAHGAPYFAAAAASPDAARELASAHPGAEWCAARSAGPDLSPGDASLLAVASGLLVWHGANAFSAATGSPSMPTPDGFSRRCTVSGGSTYPRIDPAVIMLVSHGDWALLGRKAAWPKDRYSTLAGFLELGEPLEAAVAREVQEEAGVRVDLASVMYAASQPWPFPRSLMIGFHARAAAAVAASIAPTSAGSTTWGHGKGDSAGGGSSTLSRPWWQPALAPAQGFDLLPGQGRRAALDVGLFVEEIEKELGTLQGIQWPSADEEELEDVRWFHRDWLRAVFRAPGGAASVLGAGSFNVPGPYSLSYRLITSWVGSCPGSTAASTPQLLAQPPAAAAAAAAAPWDGDMVPQVVISNSGTFKYVLARLWDPRVEWQGRSKLLVWGDVRASYHNEVLQEAKALARPLGLQVTPLGGGRIHHDPSARTIQVYGYSAAFGPAPHELTAVILHRWFPLYNRQSITVSYDGY